MNIENPPDSGVRFVLATRGRSGRYGPQSRDMSLSELIDFLTPVQQPDTRVFPDLSALARTINEQIREHFHRYKAEKLAQDYDVLFNTWTHTGSITDPVSRSRRWEKVMDLSMAYILQAQKSMPWPVRITEVKEDHVAEVTTKGRMYCEALVFHIMARSAFEPGTLAQDVTLAGYCRWLEGWLEGYISGNDIKSLFCSAAVSSPELWPALQRITGESEPDDASTWLADRFRTAANESANPDDDWFWSRENYLEYRGELGYRIYRQTVWDMVTALRDLHYRITRIAAFLQALGEAGDGVDFTRTAETGADMEAWLAQIENGNRPLTPSSPDGAAAPQEG